MKITFLESGDIIYYIIYSDARYFFLIGQVIAYLQTPSKTTWMYAKLPWPSRALSQAGHGSPEACAGLKGF